jgi:hypothetical protein
MKLVVQTVGFFPWVVTRTAGLPDDIADEAHVCVVDVPIWKHNYTLSLPKANVPTWNANTSDVFSEKETGLLVNLNEWDIRLDVTPKLLVPSVALTIGPLGQDGKPLNGWEGMELVPCFEDLAIGALLAKDWRSRPERLSHLTLSGGTLSTFPHPETSRRTYSWQGKARMRKQPSTDTVRHTREDVTEVTMVFTWIGPACKEPTGGREQPFTLKCEDVQIDLEADPDPLPPTNPDDVTPDLKLRLDLAHALGTMLLCDVETGVDLQFRLNIIEEPQSKDMCGGRSSKQLGRPNCGPRWLFEGTRPIALMQM